LQRERTLLQIMIFSNSAATGKPSPEFCFRIKNTKDHKKIHCGGTFLFCSLIILHCLFKYMFRTRVIKMKIFVSFFSYYLYSGKSMQRSSLAGLHQPHNTLKTVSFQAQRASLEVSTQHMYLPIHWPFLAYFGRPARVPCTPPCSLSSASECAMSGLLPGCGGARASSSTSPCCCFCSPASRAASCLRSLRRRR
jgi:hypothetical protein